MYIINSGKINEYLHMVDVHQYGRDRVLSVFVADFDDDVVIIDCGTSFEIKRLLRYMKRNNISLAKVKYIIPTHHHFDHAGGLWKLYNLLKEHNSEIKILSSLKSMQMINNFSTEAHFTSAKKTFGSLIGELHHIPQSVFRIIEEEEFFSANNNGATILDHFCLDGKEIKLSALKTPGHAPDHICPFFVFNNRINFFHLGEALGLKTHATKLITTPSCSAPNFNYESYMQSIDNLTQLSPNSIGFSHFGYISGENDIQYLMKEHKSLMVDFRSMVVKFYKEKPETKYVFDKIWPWLKSKTDVSEGYIDNPMLIKLSVSMVYGMMMALGYRKE